MVSQFSIFSFNLQRWNIEESNLKQTEVSRTERIDSLMNNPKPEVAETKNEEKQTEKLVSMEKRVEVCSKKNVQIEFCSFLFFFFNALFYLSSIQEKSGKIVKEVTETTTLRVSHDTRLDIASYKMISNTTQDHRENVDVKEIRDLERIVLPDVHENGSHYEMDSASKCKILHYRYFFYYSRTI